MGPQPSDAVRAALAASPSMDGLDLATCATVASEYVEGPGDAPRHIVAYDYGMKRNILRLFVQNGCRVTVVPAGTPAGRVVARGRDAVTAPMRVNLAPAEGFAPSPC